MLARILNAPLTKEDVKINKAYYWYILKEMQYE